MRRRPDRLHRLGVLLAGLLGMLPALAPPAGAFPDRPVRFIVGAAPGGSNDVVARLLAEALTARWPHPVLVENRAGAGGLIGAEAVARAPADGHTALLTNTSHAGARVMVPNASFNPHGALAAVTVVAESPMVMLLANTVPARDVREFLALVRANPGRFDYGTTGGGGTLGMAAALFLQVTGLQMNEIPYRGGAPAQLDLAAGRIALLFDVGVTSFAAAQSGLARAVAVTTPRRSRAAPEVPTWRESGIEAEMSVWQALLVPAATPRAVRTAMQAAVATALRGKALQRRFAELGADRVLGLGALAAFCLNDLPLRGRE